MNIAAVLFENEHLSFLHKKVVSEQYILLFCETFVVLELHLLFRNDIYRMKKKHPDCSETTKIAIKNLQEKGCKFSTKFLTVCPAACRTRPQHAVR